MRYWLSRNEISIKMVIEPIVVFFIGAWVRRWNLPMSAGKPRAVVHDDVPESKLTGGHRCQLRVSERIQSTGAGFRKSRLRDGKPSKVSKRDSP